MLLLECLQNEWITGLQCGKNRSDCCSGYVFNKTKNTCVVCPDGYYGLHCKETCPYPSYGISCRHQCTCEKHQCNNIKGCSSETSTDKRFFQTSASNTPKSVSKKSKKTMIWSNDLHDHTDESSFTKTQPLMLNPNKEDQKTSIKVAIFILGVVCVVLCVLYIISYFIKSNRNPVNTFSSAIEEREVVGK